jgi:methionyl-tRNA formyltransferase
MDIFFMGSKDIGCHILVELINFVNCNPGHRIVGVLTNVHGNAIKKIAEGNDLTMFKSLDMYSKLDNIDINISVQYHEILRKAHLDVAGININLHMAPLPEYRGCNQFTLAILDERKEFGTTLHLIDEGIDSGDILFEKRFSIDKDVWVDELYEQTLEYSVILFKESLSRILEKNFLPIKQFSRIEEFGTQICYRKEIEELKKVDISWDEKTIYKYIRATSMPGFEPPYLLINNHKVYLNREYKNG